MYMFLYKKSCWKITTVDLLLTFFLENQTLINTLIVNKNSEGTNRIRHEIVFPCSSLACLQLVPNLFPTRILHLFLEGDPKDCLPGEVSVTLLGLDRGIFVGQALLVGSFQIKIGEDLCV